MKQKERVGRGRKAGGVKIASRRIARLKASGEGGSDPLVASGAGRRPVKKRITLYLDADVLAWFKQKPRYQKEINRALWKVTREGLY
ncbi:MAG: BrnA antitoxin family protein [Terriglobales bacterium]|jgi:uncharacterized protein (DUF4415 family)